MIPWWPQLSKQRVERIKAWLARSRFAQNRPVILVWRVVQEMGADDATHLAAGVAYYAIFSLFPLLLGPKSLPFKAKYSFPGPPLWAGAFGLKGQGFGPRSLR